MYLNPVNDYWMIPHTNDKGRLFPDELNRELSTILSMITGFDIRNSLKFS